MILVDSGLDLNELMITARFTVRMLAGASSCGQPFDRSLGDDDLTR
jgi:hypothetical protein